MEKQLRQLTEADRRQVVQVMTGITGRCQGDTDETVDLTGPEVESLLVAFGQHCFEKHVWDVLKSSEPALTVREHYFISGDKNPETLIRNAQTLVDIATTGFAIQRLEIIDSLVGIKIKEDN